MSSTQYDNGPFKGDPSPVADGGKDGHLPSASDHDSEVGE
jgi:hypothetical protein